VKIPTLPGMSSRSQELVTVTNPGFTWGWVCWQPGGVNYCRRCISWHDRRTTLLLSLSELICTFHQVLNSHGIVISFATITRRMAHLFTVWLAFHLWSVFIPSAPSISGPTVLVTFLFVLTPDQFPLSRDSQPVPTEPLHQACCHCHFCFI
jgi:hypothetical protein